MGEVTRPHGLNGEVAIHSFTEDPRRFEGGSVLLLRPVSSEEREIKIATSKRMGSKVVVLFEGIEDRDSAEGLRGSLAFVPASQLSPLEEDAFWEHQLTGAQVTDREGKSIGTISRVIPRLEQDLWELESEGRRILIPASKSIVISVDLERKEIVIDPPAGLLD